eukprot:GFYU01003910.1.p1 GENE.GFYU01003910.1~~GFYU01003910.1.p1  ORF type:complete len:495 (-),score=77.64 GFYU01003910.1:311-1795(-)
MRMKMSKLREEEEEDVQFSFDDVFADDEDSVDEFSSSKKSPAESANEEDGDSVPARSGRIDRSSNVDINPDLDMIPALGGPGTTPPVDIPMRRPPAIAGRKSLLNPSPMGLSTTPPLHAAGSFPRVMSELGKRRGKESNSLNPFNTMKSPPMRPSSAGFAGSFTESLLSGRMLRSPISVLDGFTVDISPIPEKKSRSSAVSYKKLQLPMETKVYNFGDADYHCPYVSHGSIKTPHRVPSAGTLRILLSNPQGMPLKMFLFKYDLRKMEPGTKTFMRQRIASDTEGRNRTHYLIHIWFAYGPHAKQETLTSSKSGKKPRLFMYKDMRICFPPVQADSEEAKRLVTTYEDPSNGSTLDPMYFPLTSADMGQFGMVSPSLRPFGIGALDDDMDPTSGDTSLASSPAGPVGLSPDAEARISKKLAALRMTNRSMQVTVDPPGDVERPVTIHHDPHTYTSESEVEGFQRSDSNHSDGFAITTSSHQAGGVPSASAQINR